MICFSTTPKILEKSFVVSLFEIWTEVNVINKIKKVFAKNFLANDSNLTALLSSFCCQNRYHFIRNIYAAKIDKKIMFKNLSLNNLCQKL